MRKISGPYKIYTDLAQSNLRVTLKLGALVVTIFTASCGATDSGRPNFKEPSARGPKNIHDSSQTPSLDINTGPCPRHPIMFLHGFLAGRRMGSFAGVTQHFQAKGCNVIQTEVSTLNSNEIRGAEIAKLIKEFRAQSNAEKINIIAHSQGGLDARYAISRLGMSSAVASLTTLATPHRGTAVADAALLGATNPLLGPITKVMLNLIAGFVSTQNHSQDDVKLALNGLSTRYVRDQFNPATPDAPGIYYQSWGARTGQGTKDRMKIMFLMTQPLIANLEGPNDGVTSVASSKWGNFRGVVDADHLDQVGIKMDDQSSNFNHLKFLDGVVDDLRSKGY